MWGRLPAAPPLLLAVLACAGCTVRHGPGTTGSEPPPRTESRPPHAPREPQPHRLSLSIHEGGEADFEVPLDGLGPPRANALVHLLVPYPGSTSASRGTYDFYRREDAGPLVEVLRECDAAMSPKGVESAERVALRRVLESWFAGRAGEPLTPPERARLADAVAHYCAVVHTAQPHGQVPRLILADALGLAREWSAAVDQLRPAVAKLPRTSMLRLMAMARLAEALVGLGRVDEAETVVRQASAEFDGLRSFPEYEDMLTWMHRYSCGSPTR